MADLIITNEYRGNKIVFCIYELLNGNRTLVNEIISFDYNEIIDYINENYEYARILCGKNII